MSTIVSVTITSIKCATELCGIYFGIDEEERQRFCNNHETFYCPRGHANHYPSESKQERLERLLRIANSDKDKASEMLQAAEAKLQKVEKRISKGVCPKCNRYFHDVHRHMESKHARWCKARSKRRSA